MRTSCRQYVISQQTGTKTEKSILIFLQKLWALKSLSTYKLFSEVRHVLNNLCIRRSPSKRPTGDSHYNNDFLQHAFFFQTRIRVLATEKHFPNLKMFQIIFSLAQEKNLLRNSNKFSVDTIFEGSEIILIYAKT